MSVIDAPALGLLRREVEFRVRLGRPAPLATGEDAEHARDQQHSSFHSQHQTNYYGGRTPLIQALMDVTLKRVYLKPSVSDGTRVLVDRLWPRGLTKEAAQVDAWLKGLAPSNELRRWYHARPTQWPIFRKRYLEELAAPEANAALQELYALATSAKRLTLLFGSRNEEQNNATVLRDLLQGMHKPPSSSGPARAAAAGRIRKSARRR